MNIEENNFEHYLGDGVYVSFDGYHINVAVNDHTNHVVALEPQVVKEFMKYIRKIEDEKIIIANRIQL